jgi:hypothetical protein
MGRMQSKSTDPIAGLTAGPNAEQTFFSDPAVDRLLGIVFSLAGELHVMRDRVARLEAALAERGIVDSAELDVAIPDGALEARLAADRTALVRHLFEGVSGRLASKS